MQSTGKPLILSNRKLTIGGLFSGIGGFELGMQRAGFEIDWMCEIDPFCQKVLKKHWPNVRIYNDVHEINKSNTVCPDVIVGGFPCQPHSLAGKRKGSADDRNLWPEYSRIITELRPAWVVGENVPGIKTTILDQVLSDLENMDYATATFIIPACAVDAPHRRERVWIVAYANNKGLQRRDSKELSECTGKWAIGASSTFISHPNSVNRRPGAGRQNGPEAGNSNGWQPEPGVGRVANGVPNRVDRLRSLGNAVVPQVAEFIGNLIVKNTGSGE